VYVRTTADFIYLGFSPFCWSVGAPSASGSVLFFSSRQSSTESEVRGSAVAFAASFGSSAGASSTDNRFMVVGGGKSPEKQPRMMHV
jgi:hypothetical protein